jgi:hypothetical protein
MERSDHAKKPGKFAELDGDFRRGTEKRASQEAIAAAAAGLQRNSAGCSGLLRRARRPRRGAGLGSGVLTTGRSPGR